MTETPVIRATRIEVRHCGQRVLGPLDLEVRPREHVLVVGASGSGKTTLLRAIAGLQRLSSGRIELFGAPANDGACITLPPDRRAIGYLFQGGALWPHMSVRRTLEFVLSCRRVPRADRARRVDELLEMVDLHGHDERKPGTLSGGEAQRLSLARALAMEPRLLLLDEPLGPLDAELRSSLLAMLAGVEQRLGLTTLHVTHDPCEVAHIATRSLRLVRGCAAPVDPVPSPTP